MRLKPTEILLILFVVLLLFGAKRLPDLAQSVGKSLRILRSEVKDQSDSGPPAGAAASTPAATSNPLRAPQDPDVRPTRSARAADGSAATNL